MLFCEDKQKAGLFTYHLEGLRVPPSTRAVWEPLLQRISQIKT